MKRQIGPWALLLAACSSEGALTSSRTSVVGGNPASDAEYGFSGSAFQCSVDRKELLAAKAANVPLSCRFVGNAMVIRHRDKAYLATVEHMFETDPLSTPAAFVVSFS